MTPRERAVVATVATRFGMRRQTLTHVQPDRRWRVARVMAAQTGADLARAFDTLQAELDAAEPVRVGGGL